MNPPMLILSHTSDEAFKLAHKLGLRSNDCKIIKNYPAIKGYKDCFIIFSNDAHRIDDFSGVFGYMDAHNIRRLNV